MIDPDLGDLSLIAADIYMICWWLQEEHSSIAAPLFQKMSHLGGG